MSALIRIARLLRRRWPRAVTVAVLGTALGLTATVSLTPQVAQADAERFRTQYPHAFVSNSTGRPVAMNGVNLRGAVAPNGWRMPRSELQHIRDAGFNMVRLALEWKDFEPARGSYNRDAFAALEDLLDDLDDIGIHVILDPVHIKGAGPRDGHWFEVPSWVWATAPAITSENAAKEALLRRVADHAGPYLEEMTRRVADRDEVIAIDVVNEVKHWPPIDRVGDNDGQDKVLDLYDGLITRIRRIDPDQIVIIEPIYGNSDPRQSSLDRLSGANRRNLIWSVHDYYTGDLGTGYAGHGTAIGTHVWSGRDYPYGSQPHATLLAGQRAHLAAHVNWAGRWQVPVFIGEYGIALEAPNGAQFLRDKTQIYNEPWGGSTVGLPRAYWGWTYDGRFELHDPTTHATASYASILTGNTPQPPPPASSSTTTTSTSTTTTAAPPVTSKPTTTTTSSTTSTLATSTTTTTTTAAPPTPPTPSTSPPVTSTPAPPPAQCGGTNEPLLVDGAANLHGFLSTAGNPTRGGVLDVAVTSDGCGAWILHADGSVVAHGSAPSLPRWITPLRAGERVTALVAAPDGAGAWLVTDQGRVMAVGGRPSATADAVTGSSAALVELDLAAPIVDATATADGAGLLLVGSDGGVFALGTAYHGSLPALGLTPSHPAIGIVAGPGGGYWVVASDGGVFAFGAPFHGSLPLLLGDAATAPAIVGGYSVGAAYSLVDVEGRMYRFGPDPSIDLLAPPGLDSPIVAVS